jgi:formamidopyrimidine-DNA glycosylase
VPELPDVELYLSALRPRVIGRPIMRARVASPFFVRTFDPPMSALEGRVVRSLRRIGKRLVWEFDADLFAVVHLMIAGRLRWRDTGAAAVAAMDPGGADVFSLDGAAYAAALRGANHTLKRSLTDPHLFSGIGNAYSDEILHAAQLSPVKLTRALTDSEIDRLFEMTRHVLGAWTKKLLEETGDRFPEKVTAFRPEMAVHGKYGKPCPRCGKPVQRIRYAANESNYCPTCQTEGKLLADRSLSRLMRGDWPKTLEELEAKKDRGRSLTTSAQSSFAARAASFIPSRAPK